MNECDNSFDVDELTKRIEESIKKLEQEDKNQIDLSNKIPTEDEPMFTVEQIDQLLSDIDGYLSELSKEDNKIDLDLDALTKDINDKLDAMEEDIEEPSLEKTLYDLSEISDMIKETLNKINKEKEKKRKKAMYCDMARKKNNKNYKNYKNKYNKNKSTK